MARRTRGRTAKSRFSGSRGARSTRKAPATRFSARKRAPARRRAPAKPQTIRIVLEQPQPQALAQPLDPSIAAITPGKRARF